MEKDDINRVLNQLVLYERFYEITDDFSKRMASEHELVQTNGHNTKEWIKNNLLRYFNIFHISNWFVKISERVCAPNKILCNEEEADFPLSGINLLFDILDTTSEWLTSFKYIDA